MSKSTLGIAVIGMNGAVATTAVAGIELVKSGAVGLEGLPLAGCRIEGLAAYDQLVFDGWDLSGDDLGTAAKRHGVLGDAELSVCRSALRDIRPRPAVGSADFCANIDGDHRIGSAGHRATIDRLQLDLADMRKKHGLERLVVINLASVERLPDLDAPCLKSLAAFEHGLDSDDAAISPAMLYAYAAIKSDTPYANFTPSMAADIAPLSELALQRNVPVAGKDGKTGQTLLKTVIAPALKARALHVDGWFSTNILGNGDGKALDDPKSLASKVATKKSVLDDMLGYPVDDHIVHIHYYKPRGDNKEAWDNVDISGFLGQKMQLKINFLCRDSVLAAPLVIEIARSLDLANQRGQGGVREQLGLFFKAPQTRDGRRAEHAFATQQDAFDRWLGDAR